MLEPVPDLAAAKLVPAARMLSANGMRLAEAKHALEAATWGTARLIEVAGEAGAIVAELAGLGFPAHVSADPSPELLAELTAPVAVPTDSGTIWKAAPLVRRVRSRLGLSQAQFAGLYGIPVASIRDWEQGRAEPTPTVVSYLLTILGNPRGAARALTQGRQLAVAAE